MQVSGIIAGAMPDPIVLEISWQDVVSKFSAAFLEVFPDSNSKRLYFFDRTIVDGATASWIPVAILDGMLGMLDPTIKVRE